MARLKNIHPGEVLKEEFLKPLIISAYRLRRTWIFRNLGYLRF